MGLFLAPFSGHAVGGGGHGIIDPPPPGADPGSGPRAEVDFPHRMPLRLLKTTMNKHQPKFMKVVPPGQQRGTIAPPYAWDALERSDWGYKLRKPSKLGEAEQLRTDVLPPHPVAPMGAPKRPTAPRRGDTRRLPRPKPPSPQGPSTPPRPAAPDPRKARIDAIRAELQKLHQEVQQLMLKKKSLQPQAPQGSFTGVKGGGSVATRHEAPIDFEPLNREKARSDALGHQLHRQIAPRVPKQQRDIGFNILRKRHTLRHRGLVADLERSHLRLIEAMSDDDYGAHLSTMVKGMQKRERRAAAGGSPIGLTRSPTPIEQVTQEIAQKRRRIQQLTFELHMLQRQAHESTGLSSKNLRRLGLLLK